MFLLENWYDIVKKKYAKYQKGRGYKGTVKPRNLHMLRETKPIGVYVELGNIQNDKKQTFGFYLGVGKINFSFIDELSLENNIEAGLVSPGIGYLLAYERFNFGTTLGLDFALGDNSSKWNFQGSTWLGISLGYSLFSF